MVRFYSGVSAVCWPKNGQTQDAKRWEPIVWITNGIVNNPHESSRHAAEFVTLEAQVSYRHS
jgi:hypothetical protein